MPWYWTIVVVYVICLASAFFTAKIADSKSYKILPWFLVGFVMPIIGLIAIAGMSPAAPDPDLRGKNKTVSNWLQLLAFLASAGILLFAIQSYSSDLDDRTHKATLSIIQMRHELGQIREDECMKLVLSELRRTGDADTLFFLRHGHTHIYVKSR